MTKWEYCYIDIGWPGGLSGNYIAYVNYMGAKGVVKQDELSTDVPKSKNIVTAISIALAKLGQEGWELVTLQRETTNNGFTKEFVAILKRPVV